MSTTIDAVFFWGYAEPIDEEQQDKAIADAEENNEDYPVGPWGDAYGLPNGMTWDEKKKLPYDVGYYGVGRGGGITGYTAFFLAIREAYFEASWHEIQVIDPTKLIAKPEWDKILQDAAKEWNIDLTGLTPGWHLAPLFLQ
jgi:hypothetical protein